MSSPIEASVRIFEVGPRDGLQNEKRKVKLADKLRFVQGLVEAGVRDLELGAFVRSDKVPQMADTESIYRAIRSGKLKLGRARAWSLVPNRKGLANAKASGATHIAIFTAATSSFTKANIGMTVEQSLTEYRMVVSEARAAGMKVRGYVSTAFGCPFEGKVAPKSALDVIHSLLEMGVDQVSIGDTIGVATPNQVDEIVMPPLERWGPEKIAVHFHDTRGTALANTLRALDRGVTVVDASAGGLGGCPFAPGATGNLATEDLVYMLNGMGVKTGIDLDALCEVSLRLAKAMKRELSSRYLMAYASKRRKK